MTGDSGIFLGIDHGGSTTTALLFAPGHGTLATSSVPMPKRHPAPGIVEHDPRDFFTTSLEAANKALGSACVTWYDVKAIGVANQGETSMAWSGDTSEAFGPALSWEDRRTADICKALAAKGVDALTRQRTGIVLDPYFSASKFHWLASEVPEARAALARNRLRMGSTDAYVIDRLTRGEVHATDPGTASRTALFDIRSVSWDRDLLDAFDLAEASLPRVRRSCGSFGTVTCAEIPRSGIPISADVVDAHAALFAQGCFDSRRVKATYGTGAFIEVNTGRTMIEPDGKLPVLIAWQIDDDVDYALEGGVFSCGSAIDWAVQMGLVPSASETAALAACVEDAGGVTVIPAFAGLAAPHWLSNAKAGVWGLGLDTTKAHVARALLDGVAFACGDVILTLNDRLDGSLAEVKADGGPSRNPYLMQRQADLLGLPVVVSEESDMTALGAALMAAIGAGDLTLDDVMSLPRRCRTYDPAWPAERREEAWANWDRGIRMVKELACR